jgi:hypothetical protein
MSATVFNLYRTSNEIQVFLQKVSENAGELTDDLIMELHSIISSSKFRIEDAILAKRNLELLAEQAKAQAKVFQQECESCKATSDRYQAISDKLSQAMIPVLELTGNVSTVAGTAFIRRTPSYTFTLRDGAQFFELPNDCWRQRDPELNKARLKELAQTDKLPEQINVSKSETVSVVIKKPTPKATGYAYLFGF